MTTKAKPKSKSKKVALTPREPIQESELVHLAGNLWFAQTLRGAYIGPKDKAREYIDGKERGIGKYLMPPVRIEQAAA